MLNDSRGSPILRYHDGQISTSVRSYAPRGDMLTTPAPPPSIPVPIETRNPPLTASNSHFPKLAGDVIIYLIDRGSVWFSCAYWLVN
jgi:hypothetical protein